MIANSYVYRPPTSVTPGPVRLLPTSSEKPPLGDPLRAETDGLTRILYPPARLDALGTLATIRKLLPTSRENPPLGDWLRAESGRLTPMLYPAARLDALFWQLPDRLLPVSIDAPPIGGPLATEEDLWQAIFRWPEALPLALAFLPRLIGAPPPPADPPPIGNDPFRALQDRFTRVGYPAPRLETLFWELPDRLLPVSSERPPGHRFEAVASRSSRLPLASFFRSLMIPFGLPPPDAPPLGDPVRALQTILSLLVFPPAAASSARAPRVLPISVDPVPLREPRRLLAELLTPILYPQPRLDALFWELVERLLPTSTEAPPVSGPLALDEEAWQTIFRWPEALPSVSWFASRVLPESQVVILPPPLGDPFRALQLLVSLLLFPGPGSSSARFGPMIATSRDPVPLGDPFRAWTEWHSRLEYPAAALGTLTTWELLRKILAAGADPVPRGLWSPDRLTPFVYPPASLGVLAAWEAIDRLLPVSSERPPIGDPVRAERLIQLVATVDREAAEVLRLFFRPRTLLPPPIVAALRRALLIRLFGSGGGRSDRD